MKSESEMAAEGLPLPSSLRNRLERFQRAVWRVKLIEGFLAALFGIGVSLVFSFGLDRLVDTPPVWRAALLVLGAAGFGLWVPNQVHNWVWGTRTLEQVSRLLRRSYPRLGDQLLGIVELARNASGSPALIRAAFDQADQKVDDETLEKALPRARWGKMAAGASVVLCSLIVGSFFVPEALWNAGLRWVMPWKDTPRYTFAQLEDSPHRVVVPYAEDFEVGVKLKDDSPWRPESARANLGSRIPVVADRSTEDEFVFSLPSTSTPEELRVTVGDEREVVEVVPMTRPELISLRAKLRLPDYLRRPEDMEKEVRDGTISVLRGSQAQLEMEASRPLMEAKMDGQPARVQAGKLLTFPREVQESFTQTLEWKDGLGLEAREPLQVQVKAVEDLAPRVTAKLTGGGEVIIATEVVAFDLRAVDDYGVRELGLRWEGDRQTGQKLVAAGSPVESELSGLATFCAAREGVKPQTLYLSAYAMDYLPGRDPSLSRPFVLHILNPEQHLMWISEEMEKWFRRAEEIYDRERQLSATNRELRRLSEEELDEEKNRRRLESQAEAEQSNARRLDRLNQAGQELAEQAAKNEQFDAKKLDQFAKTLQAFEDMANKGMPSIADLLKRAAEAKTQQELAEQRKAQEEAKAQQEKGAPSAKEGEKGEPKGRPKGGSKGGSSSEKGDDMKVKGEQNWLKKPDDEQGKSPGGGQQESDPGKDGIGLPSTQLGTDRKAPDQPQEGAKPQLDQAVVIQTGMLEELRKISSELKELLPFDPPLGLPFGSPFSPS
ncbi:MAG: hypothetical protein AAGJ31_09555, partial [Verrucomicrobiota bacterium]